MYEWLYRRGLTPWVAAGGLQAKLVAQLLDHEEAWHGGPSTLLDIGCGSGEHSITAARRGWSVFGVDGAPTAIRRARLASKQAGLNIEFFVGDVRQLTAIPGLPSQISAFVDVGCYHGLSRRDRRLVANGIGRLAAPRASLTIVGLACTPILTALGITADGLASDFPSWSVELGHSFRLAVPGPLRRAPFRVIRLTKED